MAKKNVIAIWSFGSCLALAACRGEAPAPSSEQPEQETSAAPAPIMTAAPEAAQAEIDPASIPTEEDFEEEAEQSIKASNLEQRLDELEKELAAEAP